MDLDYGNLRHAPVFGGGNMGSRIALCEDIGGVAHDWMAVISGDATRKIDGVRRGRPKRAGTIIFHP